MLPRSKCFSPTDRSCWCTEDNPLVENLRRRTRRLIDSGALRGILRLPDLAVWHRGQVFKNYPDSTLNSFTLRHSTQLPEIARTTVDGRCHVAMVDSAKNSLPQT